MFATYLRLPVDDEERRAIEAGGAAVPGRLFYRAQQARGADEVIGTILRLGGEAEAWEADLADPRMIPELFDRVEETLGPVVAMLPSPRLPA